MADSRSTDPTVKENKMIEMKEESGQALIAWCLIAFIVVMLGCIFCLLFGMITGAGG